MSLLPHLLVRRLETETRRAQTCPLSCVFQAAKNSAGRVIYTSNNALERPSVSISNSNSRLRREKRNNIAPLTLLRQDELPYAKCRGTVGRLRVRSDKRAVPRKKHGPVRLEIMEILIRSIGADAQESRDRVSTRTRESHECEDRAQCRFFAMLRNVSEDRPHRDCLKGVEGRKDSRNWDSLDFSSLANKTASFDTG